MLDQTGDVSHMANNLPHGRAGASRERRSVLDTMQRITDQAFDFASGARAPMGERTDLLRHHRETPSVTTRTGRFDRRVERKEVGLKCNALDHRDHVAHPMHGLINLVHLVDALTENMSALLYRRLGLPREAVCRC